MTPILDHLGNEIKEGMAIYLVQTNIHEMACGMLIPDKGYVSISEAKDTSCWVLGEAHLVKSENGRLFIEYHTGEYKFNAPLNSEMWFEKQTIAIQGISDQEPETANNFDT